MTMLSCIAESEIKVIHIYIQYIKDSSDAQKIASPKQTMHLLEDSSTKTIR